MTRLFAVLAALAGTSCAPTFATPETVDARAVLPDQKLRKDQYVRYYLRTAITSDEDLPFTTSPTFRLAAPRAVWLGMYAQTGIWTEAPGGVRVLKERDQFPQFVHGGCKVVNIVADAKTGETLGSWCNADNGPPAGGMPPALPVYLPDYSPLR